MHIATDTLHGLDDQKVWNITAAFQHLARLGIAKTKRTAERRLKDWGFIPPEINLTNLTDEYNRPYNRLIAGWELKEARSKRKLVIFIQLSKLPNAKLCLMANDPRGERYWQVLSDNDLTLEAFNEALKAFQSFIQRPIALFSHGELAAFARKTPSTSAITICNLACRPIIDFPSVVIRDPDSLILQKSAEIGQHLAELEAESIHIIREATATAENPVMLYSIGKDSSVMLHLARKAFYPSTPPFPLLHVDTQWKFQEMYAFRDKVAHDSQMKLLVYTNPEATQKNINPFDHGSALHTQITKTEGLKKALDTHHFDVAFGGARRDEEKSRSKERIFSFRSPTHLWDPKNQRPELWNLYNTDKNSGETIRVFPLSNWTELDVWEYIYRENIPIVPLYYAKERPVLRRDDMIIMVDDDRMKLFPDEDIQKLKIRFRTLGCYPLSGAIESEAETLPQILCELFSAQTSERQGRLIDTDSSGSMEKKKREGYF